MKRESFSIHLVRSARYGTTFTLKSMLHKLLVVWADTCPEISEYAVSSPTFEFFENGKARQTSIPLSGQFRDGEPFFWDFSYASVLPAPSIARQVRQAQALERGAAYLNFDALSFGQNVIEKKNRQSAHSLLYLAHALDTAPLETLALMALVEQPLTVQQLALELAIMPTRALVVVLRLWMTQKASIPMRTQLMQPSWPVVRAGYES